MESVRNMTKFSKFSKNWKFSDSQKTQTIRKRSFPKIVDNFDNTNEASRSSMKYSENSKIL